jgi:hypothetical protein
MGSATPNAAGTDVNLLKSEKILKTRERQCIHICEEARSRLELGNGNRSRVPTYCIRGLGSMVVTRKGERNTGFWISLARFVH